MRGPRSQPAIPAAILAAAVMLSISSAADVTVAAVLMNAGRHVPSRAVAQGESLGQWLSRFTDAARQMRGVLTGDEASFSPVHAAALSRDSFSQTLQLLSTLPADATALPHAPPMIASLTDLPPPRA